MFFRKRVKRETITGKGKEDTKALHKIFDVLNYTPVRYGFLSSWILFTDTAREALRNDGVRRGQYLGAAAAWGCACGYSL